VLYEALFRLLPFGIAVIDHNLVVCDVNDAFATLTGMTRQTLIGAPFVIDFDPAGRDGVRRAILDVRDHVTHARIAPGRAVTVTIRPFAEEGRALAVATVEELDGDSAQLAEIYRSLREIKHEMNNPLTGALGNITLLLRRGDLDDKARRRLATAEQEIKKVSLLVARLSELAQPNDERQAEAAADPS
jgi:PAS domain S-box-containing protein